MIKLNSLITISTFNIFQKISLFHSSNNENHTFNLPEVYNPRIEI